MSSNSLNSFAHKLFNQIGAGKNENYFVSPFSIATALSMCQAGARSETSAQLKALLNVSHLNDQQILELNSNYISNVNTSLGGVTIKTANKIYPNQGFHLRDEYLSLIQKNFHSDVQQLNYNDAEKSSKIINDWVSSQTNEKIQNLIPSSVINALTRLILVNAIYFKGQWLTKFKADQTKPENFHLADGSVQKVDMMKIYNKKFRYQYRPSGINANTCELPYAGEKVSMTIVLPHEGVSLDQVERELNENSLTEILSNDVSLEPIRLNLPKFKLECKNELSRHLKSLGATLPFDESAADFSGITEESDGLHISKVVHQAVVEVNEEGTEAAAATGIVMMTRCAMVSEPFDFICNRPFLFIIHENNQKNILFYGKYARPE